MPKIDSNKRHISRHSGKLFSDLFSTFKIQAKIDWVQPVSLEVVS